MIPIINDPNSRTFKAVVQAMQAARAKLPQGFVFNPNLTAGSKLTAGMVIGPDNRPRRIPNSDPSVYFGQSKIENAIMPVSIDADLDESEISVDDATELLPPAVVKVAGEEDQELTYDSNLSEPELREEAEEDEARVETGAE